MKKVLVVGAAKSGLAAMRFLHKNGYDVYLTDAKVLANRDELISEGIKVYDGGHPDLLKEIDFAFVVKNPGIRYTMPLIAHFVEKKIPIYNEIEVGLSHQPQHRYVAITGTNGKTTTTTMCESLLKTLNPENVACGNIGYPVCDALLNVEDGRSLDLAIEIGAFQLLGVETFKPHVSVITNLSEDHIDFFGTLDRYYSVKTKIYQLQDENDYFLRNIDDEAVMKYAQNIPCQVIDFSLKRTDCDVYRKNNRIYFHDVELVDLDRFQLVGEHNVQNCMIASAMCYLMGVSPESIHEVMANFKGVPHRIEYIRELNGVKYYNDSKGTNVDSTIVALKAFSQPVHLLVGGYDKKVGFDDLIPYLGNVKCMYAFGQTKHMFEKIFGNVRIFENMHEALDAAHQSAQPGEVVLLSPVCASWDQYPNFEVRGDEFRDIVNAYE
ncbi:MAG: UDP-N-acetylmuramoyl-L-alanine--D-glutamate ligase [Erysipelotrichaceae bacterium]|nr:UDP-N-acetylmuramoyl-L-alanine--D-glutamate ligase [Erysipelotrichaceae bacterium]